MNIKVKSYQSKSSLFSSICFLVIGAILTAYADRIMDAVYNTIGTILVIIGIISISHFIIHKRKENISFTGSLVYGIIAITIGLVFIAFHTIIDESIRFIIGSWILFSGIIRLINAIRLNDLKSPKFVTLLTASIILIALGIYTILTNGLVVRVIGIITIIYSIIEIVGFVLYSKDNDNFDLDSEEPQTVLLIQEKLEEEEKPKKGFKKLGHRKIKDVETEEKE